MKFYVYEHWRPDLGICFYVGKGKARRAYKFSRNAAYDAIIAELAAQGMCAEVRMVASNLTEEYAFEIERGRIAFWRSHATQLTNRTDGGEGFSGFVRPLGIKLSDAARRKISLSRRGMKFSTGHREKLSKRKAGIKRKPFTEETRALMRIAAARREEAKRQKFGGDVRRDSRIK